MPFSAIFVPEELREAVSDRAWLQGMLDAERALAKAGAAVGLVPDDAAARIGEVCRAELYDPARLAGDGRAVGNPAEPLVHELRAAAGDEAADYVHLGATSQDIVDTAAMLVSRRAVALVLAELDRLADGCAALARAHRSTPMAARTLLQQAVPTTFGLKTAGWLVSVLEARERLAVVRDERLAAQLGGAAGTLAALGDEAPEVVSAIRSGDTVMVGGFGLVGAPLTLIDALVESSDADELTIVSNNIGEPGRGLGKLLRQGRIRRGISSYFTSNPEAVAAVNAGEIEATLVPQGTFAEAIRAAGAGIAGFLTPVGAGTLLAEGKEEHIVDGVPHVLERPIHADVALVYAARGDELGNLWYRRTARNFNPLMATAARVTIAEVGEIVSAGELEPESIHTPHLYVDELVLSR